MRMGRAARLGGSTMGLGVDHAVVDAHSMAGANFPSHSAPVGTIVRCSVVFCPQPGTRMSLVSSQIRRADSQIVPTA